MLSGSESSATSSSTTSLSQSIQLSMFCDNIQGSDNNKMSHTNSGQPPQPSMVVQSSSELEVVVSVQDADQTQNTTRLQQTPTNLQTLLHTHGAHVRRQSTVEFERSADLGQRGHDWGPALNRDMSRRPKGLDTPSWSLPSVVQKGRIWSLNEPPRQEPLFLRVLPLRKAPPPTHCDDPSLENVIQGVVTAHCNPAHPVVVWEQPAPSIVQFPQIVCALLPDRVLPTHLTAPAPLQRLKYAVADKLPSGLRHKRMANQYQIRIPPSQPLLHLTRIGFAPQQQQAVCLGGVPLHKVVSAHPNLALYKPSPRPFLQVQIEQKALAQWQVVSAGSLDLYSPLQPISKVKCNVAWPIKLDTVDLAGDEHEHKVMTVTKHQMPQNHATMSNSAFDLWLCAKQQPVCTQQSQNLVPARSILRYERSILVQQTKKGS